MRRHGKRASHRDGSDGVEAGRRGTPGSRVASGSSHIVRGRCLPCRDGARANPGRVREKASMRRATEAVHGIGCACAHPRIRDKPYNARWRPHRSPLVRDGSVHTWVCAAAAQSPSHRAIARSTRDTAHSRCVAVDGSGVNDVSARSWNARAEAADGIACTARSPGSLRAGARDGQPCGSAHKSLASVRASPRRESSQVPWGGTRCS